MAQPAATLARASERTGPERPPLRSAADRKAEVLRYRRNLSILSHGGAVLLGVALTIMAYRLFMPMARCLP